MYRGDYRRGDPGIFGFLGGLAKKVAGAVLPGAGIALTVGEAAARHVIAKRQQQIASGELKPNIVGRALMRLHSTAPVGSSLAGTPHGAIERSMAPGGGAMVSADGIPRGYHLIRKGPHAGGVARNRRMNWGNARALVRAERRIASFVHHATRYIRWVHPHKVGHAVPKFHKKRGKK